MRSEQPDHAFLSIPHLPYSSGRSRHLAFPLNIPRRGSTRHTILFISEAISLSFSAPARDILTEFQRREFCRWGVGWGNVPLDRCLEME